MNNIFQKSTILTLSIVVLILLLASFFAYLAVSKNSAQKIESSSAGTALLPGQDGVQYTDINGEPISLKDYLGKVLVVNSWASWSPQSADELINLAENTKTFAEDEVVVLAINRAEPKNTAQAYLRSIDVSDSVVLILDAEDAYYKNINGFAMPETLFYDKKGNIIFHKHGVLEAQEIIKYTQAAIEAQQ